MPKKDIITDIKAHLKGAGLDPETVPAKQSSVRPPIDQPNSILCRSCGEPEYRSKAYCECGAYLKGQIEDEYHEWKHYWEALLDRKYHDAAILSRRIEALSASLLCLTVILLLFGVLDYVTSTPLLLLYLLVAAFIFTTIKMSEYYKKKAILILREKDLLTFDLYSEHIRQIADEVRRQRNADAGDSSVKKEASSVSIV